MSEESIVDFNDYNKVCHILNTVTKLDVRLIDQKGMLFFN